MPLVYYNFINEVHLYSDLFDWPSIILAAAINVFGIGIAMLSIKMLPASKDRVKAVIDGNGLRHLFYVSVFFKLIYGIVSGGINGVIAGEMNGTMLNYANIFLNPTILMACIFLLENGQRKAYVVFLLYAIEETLSGSRGAIMMLPLLLIYGQAFEGFDSKRKEVWRMLKVSIAFAPFVFMFATALRTDISSMDIFDICNMIVGRISSLELAMIPIHYAGAPEADWNLFFDKYGALSQIKGIINSISPLKPYDPDILPNGYYYAIFLGRSIDYVKTYYSSIPITLPVFVFLYTGVWGVVWFAAIMNVYFVFVSHIIRHPVLCVISVLQLYSTLIYFDFVFLFKVAYSFLLTGFLLMAYLSVRNMLAYSKLCGSRLNGIRK